MDRLRGERGVSARSVSRSVTAIALLALIPALVCIAEGQPQGGGVCEETPTLPGMAGHSAGPRFTVGEVQYVGRAREIARKPAEERTVAERFYLSRYRTAYSLFIVYWDRQDYEEAVKASDLMIQRCKENWMGPYLKAHAAAMLGWYQARNFLHDAEMLGYGPGVNSEFPPPVTEPVAIIESSLAEACQRLREGDWFGAETALYRVRYVVSEEPIAIAYYAETDYLLGEVSLGFLDWRQALQDFARAQTEKYDASRVESGIRRAEEIRAQDEWAPVERKMICPSPSENYEGVWSPYRGRYSLVMPGCEYVRPELTVMPRAGGREGRGAVLSRRSRVYPGRGGEIHSHEYDVESSLRWSAVVSGLAVVLSAAFMLL